jgi:hypothetical protein
LRDVPLTEGLGQPGRARRCPEREITTGESDWFCAAVELRCRVESSGIWYFTLRPTLHRFLSSWLAGRENDDQAEELSPSTATPEDASSWLFAAKPGRGAFSPVTKPARRRPEPPQPVRWPPKDGQPTPTLKPARLSLSKYSCALIDEGYWALGCSLAVREA